jgi:hypothetical protein
LPSFPFPISLPSGNGTREYLEQRLKREKIKTSIKPTDEKKKKKKERETMRKEKSK